MDFKKISELINTLPEEIKKIIFSTQVFEKLEDLAVLEKMTEEQFLRMCDEVSYILIGNENIDNFETKLRSLNLDSDVIKRVSMEIKKTIFMPILNILEKNEKNKPSSEPKEVMIDRLEEISDKYGLTPIQKNSLIEFISKEKDLLVDKEKITGKLADKIGISKILEEQIIEDVNKRAIKTQKQNEVPKQPPKPQPEVPENLPIGNPPTPIAEKHDVLKKQEDLVVAPPAPTIPKYTPAPPKPSVEPVQRPVEVPRFKAVPLDESSQSESTSAENIIQNKLNNISPAKTEEAKSSPVKQYAVDPYREPLN